MRHIRLDCETPPEAVKPGLDARRSSRDSLHWALVAVHPTGKEDRHQRPRGIGRVHMRMGAGAAI
ncbi:hypothetical protein JMM63_18025 [Rhodovulum sulfidophilum]|uniref:hypothetical protein n=1 Tax=Rhodovulum sulfidophilum TaxID=35806 RepID=UPI001921A374|nr:hypothetical protein [Rhodovulum sulfidophilum]MBL3597433.1 hypothetical protein [Rhodovulum sulfidophilum]